MIAGELDERACFQVEVDMTDRLDRLCARTPDGRQLTESLIWLGAAMDEVQVKIGFAGFTALG